MIDTFWAADGSLFWPRLFVAFGLNLLLLVTRPTLAWDRAIGLTVGCWLVAYGVIR